MKDILLADKDGYIECDIDGVKLTYTLSTDPKCHVAGTLLDDDSYTKLKQEINEVCDEYDDKYFAASDILQTDHFYKYFVEDSVYAYFEPRDREEIEEYLDEAFDKVWLMRNCYISRKQPKYEVGRRSMERILNTYDDIPTNGYDDWECGYWNGIMGALRWVLGDDKNFLDT